MKKSIIIISATILTLVFLVIIFIYSGIYNVSQTAGHNPVVQWVINTTREHSVDSRIDEIKVPPLTDTAMIVSGFKHYSEMCVTCHGAPGQEMGELTKGLTPEPPELFKHADEFKPNEAFWIIKNGIKYTAMPAFGPTHSDEEIWGIVAFLKKSLANMNAGEYNRWKQQYGGKEEEHHHGEGQEHEHD